MLVAVTAPRLPAQAPADGRWTLHGSLALRYGTPLVHDSIVTALDVAQRLGVALGGGVATPVQRGWSGEAAVDLTFTGIERRQGGSAVDLGSLRTLAVTAAVRRQLAPLVSARVGIGALFYLPSDESGIFRSGTDGATPVGVAGVSYAPLWASRYGVALDVRYDIHRFLTPALRATGFTTGRFVHRLAVGVRAGTGGDR